MEWMVCSVSFNKIGWVPSGNSRPRCCKDCHRFFNHPWCSMMRSVIRYDWTKCIRPETVQQNQIMFIVILSKSLDKSKPGYKFRKRSYFLKFRSSTQLFLCRRNIMKHLCSSWLMDWALPFLPEPLPHALSISRSSQSTMTSVTWKRPPCDWCLTFTSMLHPPPPPGYTLPRRPNHANLMAGWRRVEVPPAAPPPLLVYHERLDYRTLTSFSATCKRSVLICADISICSFLRWSWSFFSLAKILIAIQAIICLP